MANINEILARAAALRNETALNSIDPERAGGIMYDTLLALNELWLQQGAALVISKIYASVAAMNADTSPVSDLTGKPIRPGMVVVIASSDSDNGSVYRYNGTSAPRWSLVGKIGNITPEDSLTSDSTQLPLAAHQGKVLDGKISQLGQQVIYNVTENNDGATFASLSALLSSENLSTLIPVAVRCGGMSIRFVQNSDNKYVRYNLIADEFTTDVTKWAIVDVGVYIQNSKFIKAELDGEGKILWGIIRKNGDFYFGTDCPQQIRDYVLAHKEEILQTLFSELATKVDKEQGKSLIDSFFALSHYSLTNPKWLEAVTDDDGKILYGRDRTGKAHEFVGLETNEISVKEANIDILNLSENGIDSLKEELEEHGIESGVTQEELNQKLSEYPKTSVADNKYAIKSLESIVSSMSDTVDDIERNVETINDVLSDLESPLPSGAITGNNVWTGANQFIQPVTGVSGTNDNNVALYGQFKNTLHRFENAADYGFLPTNDATTNTAAITNALRGGNKTLIISIPGEYLVNSTILIDDNTELIFGKGTAIKKDANYFNMFLNSGASTRTYNSNISIRGLHLIINNKTISSFDLSSPIYGLRGELAFLCAKNIYIDDFTVTDLGSQSYGIMLNQCENVVIDRFTIKGNKDAIHISATNMFVIRNGVIQTYDDAIALNAADWETSNCVQGNITNGIIENVTDEALNPTSGLTVRLLGGAWVDWYQGMSIRRSEHVVCDGRIYKAIDIPPTLDGDKIRTYYSETKPTITTFAGYQEDAGGFKWKLIRDDSVYYSSNIENIEINHINACSQRRGIVCEAYRISQWARTIHPDVNIADYPYARNINVRNSSFVKRCFDSSPYVRCRVKLENIYNSSGIQLYIPYRNAIETFVTISNFDFTKVPSDYELFIPIGTAVFVNDCIQSGAIASSITGRLSGKINVTMLPEGAIIGDKIINNDVPKVYNGTNWINEF